MANILFKRGLHANLPAAAVDGAFYLTTDSHRLYAGIGTELVDLNKYIRSFETYTALTTDWTNPQPGDFAYIKGGNILAVYQTDDTGTSKWVQINASEDTTNDSLRITGEGTDPGVLTFTVEDSKGNEITQDVQFIGTKGNDVTVTTTYADDDTDKVNPITTVTVQGCEYTLGGTLSFDSTTFTIGLTTSDDEVTGSSTTLAAGENVTFTETETGIEIKAKDSYVNGGTFTANKAGGATVIIEDSEGHEASAVLADNSLFYRVGAGDAKVAVNNQNDLPVYTISEIDAMMSGLNPMKYKGTVNAIAGLTGLTDVEIGDTYMASGTFDISSITGSEDAQYCKVGDLFIATGDETGGVLTDVTWTYVPAGDDSQSDTTYEGVVSAPEHKVVLEDSHGAVVAGIDLDVADDAKITLESEESPAGVLKTKIGHAAPGAEDTSKVVDGTDTTAPIGDAGYVITAVTNEKVDATGHVSEVTVTDITVPKAQLSGEVAADANVATVTTILEDTGANELGTSTLVLDTSKGDNLNITASGNTVTIQIEWGTF